MSEKQNPWEAEARERWGHTDAYTESARRTRGFTDGDWARVKAETEAVEAGFAAAMADGEAPEGERAMDLAERARLHINDTFYPCSHAMHAGLADLYLADARFRAHYDDRAPGLAEFVAAAIKANGQRQGA